MTRPGMFFTPRALPDGFKVRANNSGIHEKIPIDSLDTKAKTGGPTRLLLEISWYE
jgi:hypothetical protein